MGPLLTGIKENRPIWKGIKLMALPQKEYYTYADYATWSDDVRYELIEGTPYLMSPAPSQTHQKLLGRLHLEIGSFLKNHPCEVFLAPFDVRLNANDLDDTVVQPDLMVICDKTKLNGKNCEGAPDMVIEILSPSSARHDRFTKRRLYERYGVQEYWVVSPEERIIEKHVLSKDGRYFGTVFGDEGEAYADTLPGLSINLAELFEEVA